MIRGERCSAAEVQHLLAAIGAKGDRAGVVDLDRLIEQGAAYRVLDDAGATVAAYLLQPVGAVLWVTAYGGRASFDLSAVGAALFAQHGREFDAVMYRTERPGLVVKGLRHGYKVDRKEGGIYFMKKALKNDFPT